jgi:hypothetical protein
LKLEIAEQPQYKQVLRVVTIWDEDKQEELAFLTDRFDFGTTTIAAIYKQRWQIEVFFENSTWCTPLVKTFVGTSANALKTQIWTALIAMLVLKLSALEVEIQLVVVQPGGAGAPATVRLSGSVPMAGRSLSSAARTGGCARRRATACDLVVGVVGQQKNGSKRATLASGGM